MDQEALVIILTSIDSGRWNKHDVRNFVDRILNHDATTEEAEDYMRRLLTAHRDNLIQEVEEEVGDGDLVDHIDKFL